MKITFKPEGPPPYPKYWTACISFPAILTVTDDKFCVCVWEREGTICLRCSTRVRLTDRWGPLSVRQRSHAPAHTKSFEFSLCRQRERERERSRLMRRCRQEFWIFSVQTERGNEVDKQNAAHYRVSRLWINYRRTKL